jgi:hypothetical protein
MSVDASVPDSSEHDPFPKSVLPFASYIPLNRVEAALSLTLGAPLAKPGAVHLLNGLYDAHYDGAPVLAITGMTFRDLGGVRFMQGVD